MSYLLNRLLLIFVSINYIFTIFINFIEILRKIKTFFWNFIIILFINQLFLILWPIICKKLILNTFARICNMKMFYLIIFLSKFLFLKILKANICFQKINFFLPIWILNSFFWQRVFWFMTQKPLTCFIKIMIDRRQPLSNTKIICCL